MIKFEDFLYNETTIRVAEEVGPNSLEWDELHERYLQDDTWRQAVYPLWLDFSDTQ